MSGKVIRLPSSRTQRSSSKPMKARTGRASTAAVSSETRTGAAPTAAERRWFLRKWNGKQWLTIEGPLTAEEMWHVLQTLKTGHNTRYGLFLGRRRIKELTYHVGEREPLPYFF